VTIVDEPLLDRYRGPGICEWCKTLVPRREAAHLRTKGMGGWARLDVRINVASLCAPLMGGGNCHQSHHDGNEPTYSDLLAVVASRENTTQDAIEAEMDRLRLLPNNPGERRPRKRKPPKPRPPAFRCLMCRKVRRTTNRRDVATGIVCGRCWQRATSEARQAAMRKDGAA
jgi:hypothetical protein